MEGSVLQHCQPLAVTGAVVVAQRLVLVLHAEGQRVRPQPPVQLAVDVVQRIVGAAVLAPRPRGRAAGHVRVQLRRVIARRRRIGDHIAQAAIEAVTVDVGEGIGQAEINVGIDLLIPRHAASAVLRIQRFGDVGQVFGLVQAVAAAAGFIGHLQVQAQPCARCGRIPGLQSADLEVLAGDLGVAVTVVVDAAVPVALGNHRQPGVGILGHQVEAHIGILLRRAFQHIHAGLHMATAARRQRRDQVDHTGHRARSIQRRTTAFDHFDAVDEPGRNLFQAVHAAQRGQQRDAIEQQLVVGAGQAQQLYLAGVAVLAVAFHAQAIDQFGGTREVGGRAQRDVFLAQHFGADRDIGQQAFAAGGSADLDLHTVQLGRLWCGCQHGQRQGQGDGGSQRQPAGKGSGNGHEGVVLGRGKAARATWLTHMKAEGHRYSNGYINKSVQSRSRKQDQNIADDSVITLQINARTLPDVMPGRVRSKSRNAAPVWPRGGEGITRRRAGPPGHRGCDSRCRHAAHAGHPMRSSAGPAAAGHRPALRSGSPASSRSTTHC